MGSQVVHQPFTPKHGQGVKSSRKLRVPIKMVVSLEINSQEFQIVAS